MKLKRLIITVILSVCMYWTVFSQATVYDTCLNQKQIGFVITQAFALQDEQIALSLCNDKIDLLNKKVGELNSVITAKNQEISLHLQQVSDIHLDNASLLKELHSAEIKIKLQRFGIYLIGSVAIVELGYIGLKSLVVK